MLKRFLSNSQPKIYKGKVSKGRASQSSNFLPNHVLALAFAQSMLRVTSHFPFLTFPIFTFPLLPFRYSLSFPSIFFTLSLSTLSPHSTSWTSFLSPWSKNPTQIQVSFDPIYSRIGSVSCSSILGPIQSHPLFYFFKFSRFGFFYSICRFLVIFFIRFIM